MPSESERLTRRQVEGAPSLWSLLSLSRSLFSNARDDGLDKCSSQGLPAKAGAFVSAARPWRHLLVAAPSPRRFHGHHLPPRQDTPSGRAIR
jgi:hypothetical protein